MPKTTTGVTDLQNTDPYWTNVDLLNEKTGLEKWAIGNVLKLLDADNTVPFIARYRKEMTDNMEANRIRIVQTMYEELKSVKKKMANVSSELAKSGKLTNFLASSLRNCQSLLEIDELYAPFKPGSKGSLAERAREIGLETLALQLLENPRKSINLESFIQKDKKGLSSTKEIKTGIQHIIADIISKNKDIMDHVRHTFRNVIHVQIQSCRTKTKISNVQDKKLIKMINNKNEITEETANKYKQYFDFSINIKFIKPHQVLALNRGENQKILTVKVNIPSRLKESVFHAVHKKWPNADCNEIVRESIEDAYKRLIEPGLIRNTRADLKKTADKASIEVFATNLKHLLLTPPVRGKTVLGLDPGFRHGCKLAVTSSSGHVLDTELIYLHNKNDKWRIVDIIKNYRVQVVAIGNGTACRESETLISDLISKNAFRPLDVVYCIVSECGASIYSASDLAMKELPELDISYRGAVSIARRLQDPLSEFVKIEAKHLGIGMYQHDISENQLKSALDNVVEDSVSFVGADLNFSSEHLLRHIAGIGAVTAKRIVDHRERNGLFVNREQLHNVKGLGPKTFKQCAGFVRILPESCQEDNMVPSTDDVARTDDALLDEEDTKPSRKRKKTVIASKSKKQKVECEKNPLDMTIIHPESYKLTTMILKKMSASIEDIGSNRLKDVVKDFLKTHDMDCIAKQFNVGVQTISMITTSLIQPVEYDIREEFEKPLFKKGAMSLDDVKVDMKLTGRVSNVTHFGAFVDIGVGHDGLIHNSKMGSRSLNLGDRVDVIVISIDRESRRISLQRSR